MLVFLPADSIHSIQWMLKLRHSQVETWFQFHTDYNTLAVAHINNKLSFYTFNMMQFSSATATECNNTIMWGGCALFARVKVFLTSCSLRHSTAALHSCYNWWWKSKSIKYKNGKSMSYSQAEWLRRPVGTSPVTLSGSTHLSVSRSR